MLAKTNCKRSRKELCACCAEKKSRTSLGLRWPPLDKSSHEHSHLEGYLLKCRPSRARGTPLAADDPTRSMPSQNDAAGNSSTSEPHRNRRGRDAVAAAYQDSCVVVSLVSTYLLSTRHSENVN